MSDQQHSSSAIMTVAIIIGILLMIVAVPLSGIGKGGTQIAADNEADARILPVARFELKLAPAAGAGPRTAESIYNGVCGACHGAGVAGAPKKGDKAAWAPRLKAGIDALVKSAIAGKGGMPPKGGATDLTDEQIKSVIELMTR